ncbi:MAG TPA: hypothetical protein VD791_05225 [Burkholderiales bacterium]|nr:hypothetical protein [Burkholderiales bacterium]
MIKVVRLHTGSDNQSHFEDIEIPLADAGKTGFLSERVKATGVIFRITTGECNYEFRPAPRRQYVVNLEGEGSRRTNWAASAPARLPCVVDIPYDFSGIAAGGSRRYDSPANRA